MNSNFLDQLKDFKLNLTDNQVNQLEEYVKLIIDTNKKFNITAKSDFDTLLIEHVADSLAFNLVDLDKYSFVDNFKLIDLGSGGGLPGIPLSVLYPLAEKVFVESINKKARFLKEATDHLGLKNIQVIPNRIELAGKTPEHREYYDIVTARALAATNTLLEYAMPLLKIGGIFVAYKTEKSKDELNYTNKILKQLGGKLDQIINYTLADKELKRTLIIFKKVSTTPLKYPRNVGVPAKKPLK